MIVSVHSQAIFPTTNKRRLVAFHKAPAMVWWSQGMVHYPAVVVVQCLYVDPPPGHHPSF